MLGFGALCEFALCDLGGTSAPAVIAKLRCAVADAAVYLATIADIASTLLTVSDAGANISTPADAEV